MKYLIFLSLCVTAFIMANPTQEIHNSQHTYLVKTDLTKEQVENLLNEYHRNHIARPNIKFKKLHIHKKRQHYIKIKLVYSIPMNTKTKQLN